MVVLDTSYMKSVLNTTYLNVCFIEEIKDFFNIQK